ncbi:MAG: F0F1 ATP synthase subunit epsilon [bacterium]|nr:F0F1 ATP synthase subunit epsilon [bacterium]
MAEKIYLQVVTSSDNAFEATIKDIYIPAAKGEAGILEDHKPYISLLNPGEIVYTDISDKKLYLYIQDGFVEVLDNKISVISDSVEKGETLLENKDDIRNQAQLIEAKLKALANNEITPEELASEIRGSLKLNREAEKLVEQIKTLKGKESEEVILKEAYGYLKGKVISGLLEQLLEEQKEFQAKEKIIAKMEAGK